MKKEKTIKAHTRKTKSGKTVNVRQHKASYEAAEDIVKDALRKKKGAGEELASRKKKEDEISDYDSMGFTKEEFNDWYEGAGTPADRKVVDSIGRKAAADLKALKKAGFDAVIMEDGNYDYIRILDTPGTKKGKKKR